MEYEKLLEKAKEVSKLAYAPYSDFPVGACVLTEKGGVYVGCNIENASYGLTICAERNAIASAVASGDTKIKAVAIYSPKMQKCFPCGACRQVIFEFQKCSDLDVVVQDGENIKVYKINELLPEGFVL